jgi:hypothetical protein
VKSKNQYTKLRDGANMSKLMCLGTRLIYSTVFPRLK